LAWARSTSSTCGTEERRELAIVRERVASLDSINRAAKIEVAKGTAAKVRAEAEQYQRQLVVLRRLVPTRTKCRRCSKRSPSRRGRVGLEFSDVVPDGIVAGDQFDAYRYRIAVIGSVPSPRRVPRQRRLAASHRAPINLALVPSTRPSTERKAQKNEQFLEARLQIQTYVVHSGAEGRFRSRWKMRLVIHAVAACALLAQSASAQYTQAKRAAQNAAAATNVHVANEQRTDDGAQQQPAPRTPAPQRWRRAASP
jgi:hypothetical protein